MAELVMPSARRSGATGTAHIVAGIVARGAAKAFAGLAKRMAERRTIAQLRALDDRTLRDIGLHRSEIASYASYALDRRSERFRGRYY
jgi:uncharacterized protein YjiS (DUF1127 family)